MRYVFYLNGQRLDAYLIGVDGIERLAEFPASEAGHRAFNDFLDQQPGFPCQLLVDLIEEEFREETLPHVSGKDKKLLHNRHAARLYRNTPFRHSRVIFRDRKGRHNDHVLFSALTNPDLINPWLTLLKQHRLPLSGIYSLPVITRRITRAAALQYSNLLVITQQRGHHLRETFVKDSQVRFSRQAPLLDSDANTFGAILSAEVEKTWRYLNTLKLLDFNEALCVVVISDSPHLASARENCHDSDRLLFDFRDINKLAEQTGLRPYPDHAHADTLFVHLLTQKRITNHYAQPGHLFYYKTHQAGLAIRLLSAGLAAGALLWSGINLVDAMLLKQETRTLQTSIELTQNRLRQLTGASQHAEVDPEDILAAVKLSEALRDQRHDPEELLATLGNALQAAPRLVLDKLSWSTKQTTTAGGENSGLEQGPDTESRQDNLQTTLVAEGHIGEFDGSFLEANRAVRDFAGRLQKQANIKRTEITRLPLNTAPGFQLEGRLNIDTAPGAAKFAVRITLESPREQS